MELGLGLECVVQSDEEGRLADRLQHLSLGLGVLRGLGFLHDGGLLEHLHGIQLAIVRAANLPHQEHFAIGCHKRKGWKMFIHICKSRISQHPEHT